MSLRSEVFTPFASGSAPRGHPLRASQSPVVDDSDLDSDSNSGSSKKKTGFDSLVDEADNFATQIERTNKKSNAMARVSLEEELRGLSLEDDTDMDVMMMNTARGGSARDSSLSFRLNRWFEETVELIQNPTKLQVTYAVIFFGCVAGLILMGVITFALGGVRLQGDGIETARRQEVKMGDARMQREAIYRENRRKFAEMDDIRKYNSDFYTMTPDSFINFSPKTLDDVKPEDVIGKY